MKLINKHIEISIEPIKADQFFYATVRESKGGTSDRINIPSNLKLVGKRVMIIVLDSADQDDRKRVGHSNPPS